MTSRLAAVLALCAALLGPILLPLHVFASHGHAAAACHAETGAPSIASDTAASRGESPDAACPTCQILHASQHALESAAPHADAPTLAQRASAAHPSPFALARPARLHPSRAPPTPA